LIAEVKKASIALNEALQVEDMSQSSVGAVFRRYSKAMENKGYIWYQGYSVELRVIPVITFPEKLSELSPISGLVELNTDGSLRGGVYGFKLSIWSAADKHCYSKYNSFSYHTTTRLSKN
jgi:hypothetical protein